jgi:hypothetical protein
MSVYQNIQTKENYLLLLKSGMFFEFYPELTGDWEKDVVIINSEKQNFSEVDNFINFLEQEYGIIIPDMATQEWKKWKK